MDDKLKGDFAEAIIRYMFRASGINGIFAIEKEDAREELFHYLGRCKNFNYDITEMRKNLVKKNGIPIPDFAVVTYQGGLELLEVKYRNFVNYLLNDKKFKKELLDIWKEFDCKVILVTEKVFSAPAYIVVIPKGDQISYGRYPFLQTLLFSSPTFVVAS